MNITLWAKGDKLNGLGHIYRSSVLANALLSRGHTVSFITRKNTAGEKVLRQTYGDSLPIYTHRETVLSRAILKDTRPDLTIMDVEHGPSRVDLVEVKRYSKRSVVIGGVGFRITDPHSIDELVDLQIYQSPVITEEFSDRSSSKTLAGTKYIMLHEAYLNARAVRELRQDDIRNQHILISMGGADPNNLTHHIARSLGDAFPAQKVIAVYGPASEHAERKFLPHNVTIIESPPPQQFAQLMMDAAVMIAALGMTVYEAMCVGVPVACTAWSLDHEATAEWLRDKNALTYLGQWNEFDSGSMFAFVHNVFALKTYREVAIRSGQRLVDGCGAGRVADELEKLA